MMIENATVALSVSVLAAIAVPVALVLALMACLSCLNKLKKRPTGGFSNFSNSGDAAASSSTAHVNSSFAMEMEDTSVDAASSSTINLEPLPNVTPKFKLPTVSLRPRIGPVNLNAASDASLKLIVSHQPFPRNQIVYLKELGSGWFGKVIESDAEKITSGLARSKVVVKMLKDDASKEEQQLFCEEALPFRELEHPNVMRLLAQCTEISPMLMIMEFAAFGNLKQYLRNHRNEQATLIQKNRLLQFGMDAAKGLACLHAHDHIHRDLAARNCLVMSDHTLKIGDYGIAEDLYREDYLTSGSDLLPIRWMAPETLKQDSGKWTAAGYSKESDVWSLGVLLWELAMLGERPYDMLTDEAVLQGVIVDKDIRLPQPDIAMPAKDRMYEVMRFCWLEPDSRVKVNQVYELLEQLATKAPMPGDDASDLAAFENKWQHLVPNQRHESMDSTADQSSDDDSLEGIIAAAGGDHPTPVAPPRATRRKLSVRRVTIPGAEDDAEEVVAVSSKQEAKEQAPPIVPQINVVDETGSQVTKPAAPERPSSTEFTEFTSHSTDDDDDDSSEGTPNVSQIVSEKTSGAKDVLSKAKETLESESFTPDRSQAQPKPRKTSTPMLKDELSPTSTSLSGTDSTTTFVTANSSSLGNLTDFYATASENTLVSSKSRPEAAVSPQLSASAESSQDSSMNFEIMDTTAVPSVFDDASKSQEKTNTSTKEPSDTKVSDPFSTAFGFNKDDVFGDFTNGSVVGDSTAPKDSSMASADDNTSEVASKTPAVESSWGQVGSAAGEQPDPFLSLGSDLPSLSSLNVAKEAESLEQGQVFPSFSSEFSSLSSLKTDSTLTPQGQPQSDMFAFDQLAEPAKSEESGTSVAEKESQKLDSAQGLGDFSFDLISSVPDVAAVQSIEKGSEQAALGTGDLSSIPLDSGLSSTNPFAAGPVGSSSPPQPMPDLFGLGDSSPSPPGLQDSSFEVLDPGQSTQDSMSSSAMSDFDMLASFTSSTTPPVAPSAAAPDLLGGDLLQAFGGSTSSDSSPVETKQESQDNMLLATAPTDQNKQSESSLLDFSAFESLSPAEPQQEGEKPEDTTASGANATSASLIDF